MLKDIQTTLYDIFGYLLPGSIVLIGVIILFWSLFLPEIVLYIPQFTAELWVAVAVVAYIFGHICQATANLLLRRSIAPVRILSKNSVGALPSPLIDTISQKVSAYTGIKPAELSPYLLYQIADEFIVQYGKTGDRDIYIYREGFYRGSCIAFVLLAMALIVRAFHPNIMLNVDGKVYQISIAMFIFLILTALIGAGLSFSRYRRFGDYRVTQAVLGFLALHTKLTNEHKPVI